MEAYALAKSAVVPLLASPEAHAERVDEALCGMFLQILEKSGRFYRVRTSYRYEGWAAGEGLCFGEEQLALWRTAPKRAVCMSFADVQAEPKVQAEPLCTLTRGAAVSPAGTAADGWQKIRLPDGAEGFVPCPAIARVLPADRPEAAFRRGVVRTALSYLGTPYRWGGKSPLGIDCSGLCFMAYYLNGSVIFRDARIEPGFPVHEIPFRSAKPGDLLYFPGHIAMLIGNGRYVHATAGNGCHGVVINSLDPRSREYRADLPAKLTAVGSIFPCITAQNKRRLSK